MNELDNYEIRILTEADAENYFDVVDRNHKRLEDFFAGTVSRTKTVEDTRDFLVELTGRVKAKTFYPYGIIESDTKKIVGYIHVFNIDWNIPKAEIGFFADEHHTGKGITSQAVLLVTDFFFTSLGFNKMFLRTHPTNKAAQALAEKCGFYQEGLLRNDYKTSRGELVDLMYYGRLSTLISS